MDVIHKHGANIHKNQIMCCIMEKTEPTRSDGYIKSGFHIEFPFILFSRDEQRAFLFPLLEKIINESDLFSRFNDFPQSIFDSKAVTSNPWLIYGSKKGLNKQSYHLSYILNSDMEEVSLKDMMDVNHIYNYENEIIEMKHE